MTAIVGAGVGMKTERGAETGTDCREGEEG